MCGMRVVVEKLIQHLALLYQPLDHLINQKKLGEGARLTFANQVSLSHM